MAARTRFAAPLTALLALVFAGPSVGRADEPPPEVGRLVAVPNPLTSAAVDRIKQDVQRARDRKDQPVTAFVFDFNPAGNAASTDDFGPCYSLARFLLRDLADVRTVAWVRGRVSGHTVLPVLACRELAMSPAGAIGNDPQDRVRSALAGPERAAYDEVIDLRIPKNAAPVVRKMVDPTVQLSEGMLGGVRAYFDAAKPPDAIVGGRPAFPDAAPPGKTGLFPAPDLRTAGLCAADKAEGVGELAAVLGLDAASLADAGRFDGAGEAVWVVPVHGAVTATLEEAVKRRIDKAVSRGATAIILELRCGNGDVTSAQRLADHVRAVARPPEGAGQRPVLTVAYVPESAPDTAAFLAFACRRIFIAPSARLGDMSRFLVGSDPQAGKAYLKEAARENGYPEEIIDGLYDLGLGLRLVRGPNGSREWVRWRAGEPKPADIRGEDLKTPDLPLELTGSRAAKVGVAQVADSPEAVYGALGTDRDRVRSAEADFLENFAAVIRSWPVMTLLFIVGFIALFMELKMPGAAVPGIISALCFTLFFWAFWTSAVVWLAVLVFLLGLVLIGVEVFIIPGFGVTGVAGILFVVGGLALATVEQMPQTTAQWNALGRTLFTLVASLIAAGIGAAILARFLPHVPFANRLILQPPGSGPDGEGAGDGTGIPDELANLFGATGETTTVLRPAGTAQFGDRFVDVVSDGDFIPPGTPVRVIEIEGTRVVVKRV